MKIKILNHYEFHHQDEKICKNKFITKIEFIVKTKIHLDMKLHKKNILMDIEIHIQDKAQH